ncbi:hypothetical protein PsYK624_109460 [Phanerochaete sordida]|uniref:Uncharacterized protein n=1 Tax=Phanerochaete sordida TaxID=48140 RepID=A0A9P3GJN4_9APHY|nr:hypothetical protein PsYK624_109460 [Phanerochaete sordida]
MPPRLGDEEVVPTSDDEEMQQMRSNSRDLRDDGVPAADTSLDLGHKDSDGHPPSQPPIAFLAEATAQSPPNPPTHKPQAATTSSHTTANTSGTFGSLTVGAHPAIVAAVTPVAQEPAPARRKPKPRPAYKIRPVNEDGTAQPGSAPESSISNFPTPVVPPQPLTDPIETASTLSRASKGKSKAVEDDIELFSLDIAERAKARSRGKTGSKAPVVETNDIIELTSESEDELLLPSSKSKSKAKEMPRKATTSKATPAKKAPARKSPAKKTKTTHQPDPPDSTPTTIPVPTSDPLPSSQLPPSDPPLPSSANPPPASTPTRHASPPLSPLPTLPVRKRKRAVQAESDDEDAFALPKTTLPNTKSADLMPPPPPPAFFASSSQSTGPSNDSGSKESPDPAEAAAPGPKAKGKARKIATDEDEDWGGDDPQPKPKARGRKKKASEDEDEDWDKPKPKPKAKRAPKKKAGEASEGAEPDTGLDPKPKKAPARGRGKKAQAAAAEALEGVEQDVDAGPGPAAKAAPARGRGKKKVEVVIEVPSPDKRRVDVGGDRPDGVQADALPAPDPVAQPEDSELSALESDLEGKGKAAGKSTPESTKVDLSSASGKGKGKKRALLSEDEDAEDQPPSPKKAKGKTKAVLDSDDEKADSGHAQSSTPDHAQAPPPKTPAPRTPAPRPSTAPSSSAASVRRATHQIPFTKGVPMSELIRRASVVQGAPALATAHSPLAKMSKSALRRIAPLHPNRRAPPPPPPPPPKPKKTKKELELEERWEMELEDEVEGWLSLEDAERARLRRAKRDAYYGFDD